MTERKLIAEKAQSFFEELWKRGDPWEFETSEFEQRRCARLLEILSGRRYAKVLEIGCGAGFFTRLLAPIADHVVAFDISSTAIERAKATQTDPRIDFKVANMMEYDARDEGPWDLVVMSDMIYFLGWLYSFFDVGWLAMELFAATRPGGQVLLPNAYGGPEDYLMRPFLIRTYRDLFVNVGYQIKFEEIFHGTKNGVGIEMLITLFEKGNEETTGSV
jgi:2-polyprenyl-3-methyl-5-hydroxy-6-metoxy-1,4-benzoquinol methylase